MRALLWLRPVCVGLFGLHLALAVCAGPVSAAAGGSAALFARAFDDIRELYLEPVPIRRVALAGAMRLSRLDNNLGISDSFGTSFGDALTVSYEGRDVAFLGIPSGDDGQKWSALLEQVIGVAKQVSPRLAALPQEHLERAVFHGITAALDPYSRYIGPEAAGDDRAERDGFGGIGVSVDTSERLVRVSAVSPRSPADLAGIHPEDQIVAINGVGTAGCSQEDAIHQLRGPIGTAIALRVLHPGAGGARDLQLHRAFVTAPTVTMTRAGNIAVFQVASFNRTTAQQITAYIAQARRETGGKLAGIVLDLRGNPGGLLDQAVGLADLFLANGPIVAAAGRHPLSRQSFAASGRGVAAQVPMAVLLNGGSASASEIVAAALQDAGRAVVIGSASYGKGTVQTVMRMPNNGELILTWARLLSRSGYFLQQHGVVPTICTANLPDDPADILIRLQQAAAVSFAAGPRPRAALDEAGWAQMRQLCPPRRTRPAVDLALAERLLSKPSLYAEALRALPATTQLAQRAGQGSP